MSRGILVNMRRKLSHEKASRLRHADRDSFTGIAEKLARFADDFSGQVRQSQPSLPEALSDREQDNWEPLLAIAVCAGDEWVTRATKAALELSGRADKSASIGNELLEDIQHIFESKNQTRIKTANLIDALCTDEEAAWATYNRGRPISPRQIAKQLKSYGICSKPMRFEDKSLARGLELAQFSDAFKRYLSPAGAKTDDLSVTALQANEHSASDVTQAPKRNAPKNQSVTAKGKPDKACNTVTHKKPVLASASETEAKKRKF